jgi:hypothetical protein
MPRVSAAVLVVVVAAGCSSSGSSGGGNGGTPGHDGGSGGGAEGGTSGSGGSSGSSSGSSGGSGSGSSSGSSTSSGSSSGSSGSSGSSSGSSSSSGSGGDAGGCGEFTGDTQLTCSKDGNSLGDCVGGAPMVTACPNGCLRETAPQASICMGTTATNFSCTGSYGTTPVDDGNYYITSFGCYVDSSGQVQTDPDDNCIPACLSKAIAAGLCPAGSSGPACEEAVNWYTADGARFGCLARLRVTDVATGNAVVAVALDFGPGCSGENGVSHAVLDTSGRIDDYLFGGEQGASDKSLVHVVQVDDSTPLGPI